MRKKFKMTDCFNIREYMLMMTCFCPDTYNISTYSQSTHSTHSLFNTTLSFILFTLFFLSNDALADHTQSLLPRADLDKIKHQYSADVSQRFNGEGLWLANSASHQPIDDSSKILLWADLIKRMKNESI